MNKQLLKRQEVKKRLDEFANYMQMEELSQNTIRKYVKDICQWIEQCEETIEKENVLQYKEKINENYAVNTVNSKILAVNRYVNFLGYEELTMKSFRIQQADSLENVITKQQYDQMIEYAERHDKAKIHSIMRTIAYTGIRVSELKFVTAEAVNEGTITIHNKGKFRTVYMADELRTHLQKYCETYDIKTGIIFTGRHKDRVISRNAVWKELKYIANKANVPEEVVYPHSFRHLFAKEFIKKYPDLSELAGLLGHSRLETTRIYTKTSAEEKRAKLSKLDF